MAQRFEALGGAVAAVRLALGDELVDELPRIGPTTFRQLTGDLAERIEVIVRFLAVLELYKQGELTWTQEQPFDEIRIEARSPARPGSVAAVGA